MAKKTQTDVTTRAGSHQRRNIGKGKQMSRADNGQNLNERRKQSNSNFAQQRKHSSRQQLKIESTQFSGRFHSQLCRAAKYKVHAPLCSCPKVDRLREQYRQDREQRNLEEQLKDLNISDPFDNLIVVPDTKTTPAIFVCNETTLNEFKDDAKFCEKKLASEIFDTTSLDAAPFKVSCAVCLLAHQKNGFVAIVADSAQELQPTIHKARKATAVANHDLHSDHAHFICAVQLSSCKSLLQTAKTRSKHSQIVSEILMQMKNGGVDLPSTIDSASTIKLGHHFTSLLLLEGNLSNKKGQYVMILGYVDGSTKLELDLPGGKRHLGESTLESLVREVKEECSLELDKQWLSERIPRRYGGATESRNDVRALESQKENGNVYFIFPPSID